MLAGGFLSPFSACAELEPAAIMVGTTMAVTIWMNSFIGAQMVGNRTGLYVQAMARIEVITSATVSGCLQWRTLDS